MKQLDHLRQDIAKMRLVDLVEEFGKDSSRVTAYKRRMGNTINTAVEPESIQPLKQKTKRDNKGAACRWAENY